MKETLKELAAVNLPNGLVIAFINLTTVKDLVTIALGLVSIVSTLIIIRVNLRRRDDEK